MSDLCTKCTEFSVRNTNTNTKSMEYALLLADAVDSYCLQYTQYVVRMLIHKPNNYDTLGIRLYSMGEEGFAKARGASITTGITISLSKTTTPDGLAQT